MAETVVVDAEVEHVTDLSNKAIKVFYLEIVAEIDFCYSD